ncbi:UNVERIFIED_CONTAM: ERMES complex subunit mmm1 [Siphonaria sp. JEL0065]|nr:ERMES complex subunit mmm1 [Siphonaria sp. JEL0065]
MTLKDPTPPQTLDAAVNQFIKGFVFGQVILCILIFFLVKVFLLRNSDETKSELRKGKAKTWRPKKSQAPPMRQHAFESHVLAKTDYSVHSHAPESLDWVNVVLAQIIARYRSDPSISQNIVRWIDEKMNGGPDGSSRPGFLGPVNITEFSLGEEYPKFKMARMQYAEHTSNLRAEIDFSFDDQITIGVDTQVIINWPKPAIASLPVSLVLSIVKFSGTITVEFVTHPDSSETFLAISILEDYILDFEVRSLLGHRTKVKDLPKLTSLITSQLRNIFVDQIVWPSFKKLHIPVQFGAPPTPASGGAPSGDGIKADEAVDGKNKP